MMRTKACFHPVTPFWRRRGDGVNRLHLFFFPPPPPFVSSPAIRLRCNEAADEPDDNYVLKMSSAPSAGKLLLFFPPSLLHSFSVKTPPGSSPDWSPRSLIARRDLQIACAGHGSRSGRRARITSPVSGSNCAALPLGYL